MESGLSEIPSGAFALEEDRRIRKVMRKLKVFDWAAKEISRLRYEKYSRLAYTAGAVRCGSGAYQELVAILTEICQSFDLAVPELYVYQNAAPVARLIGEDKPLILLSTAMLNLVTVSEMKCVLAQQVAHLHCGHEPFLIARDLLNSAADNLGILKGLVAPVRMLLEEWYVLAQMSCDRGALLVSGDCNTVMSLLTKLAGGGLVEWGGVDKEALLQQYKSYSSVKDDTPQCPVFKTWSSLYVGLSPYARRAGKLHDWATGGGYADFISGKFPEDVKVSEDEARSFWGDFAGSGKPWEAVDIDEQIFFGIGSLDEQLKKIAGSAESFLRVGAEAAGKAAESFANALFKAAGVTGRDDK